MPASELFAFNTIVLDDLMLNCRANSSSQYRTLDYENNIIVSSKPSAIDGTTCKLTRNIIWPGPSADASNIVADPQFVDAAAKDFRIGSNSPAVDAATTTRAHLITDDFLGTPRPQGAAPDIGAYEYVP
jgi:hypothetical protein